MGSNKFSLTNLFLTKREDYNVTCDFDLFPLIKDFSFLNFVHEAKKYKYDDYGAFLVVSNEQYILGYNSGFGIGCHLTSFAKTYKEMYGGGNITNYVDAKILNEKCQNEFITASIFVEKTLNGYTGCIHFSVPKQGITQKQYDMFCQFYDDYNDEISLTIAKYGMTNFSVSYRTTNEKNESFYCADDIIQHYNRNLDGIKSLLHSMIKNSLDNDEVKEEIIIGKSSNKNHKVKKITK